MLAQVPRNGGDAPCLETSRVSLRALSNLTQLKMPLLVGCRVVGPEHADKVPFIPHHSVIPWLWKPGCWQGTCPTIPVLRRVPAAVSAGGTRR